MKKFSLIICFLFLLVYAAFSQKVSGYNYALANGVIVKMENTWSNVRAQLSYDTIGVAKGKVALEVKLKWVGNLVSDYTYAVFDNAGKVTNEKFLPGNYRVAFDVKLVEGVGKLSFEVKDVIVKPDRRTVLQVDIYDYLITVREEPSPMKGLSYYESKVNRYKDNWEQNRNWAKPAFYMPGQHEKRIDPDQPMGDYYGKIKPGTYDLLLNMEISGKLQKIWLTNFTMKPDVRYHITTNINGGEIAYTGGDYEVKILYLYPAGTAAKQKGKVQRNVPLEIIGYEPATGVFAAPPGKYDVMLNYGHGIKYEWRKGVQITTGKKTEVK